MADLPKENLKEELLKLSKQKRMGAAARRPIESLGSDKSALLQVMPDSVLPTDADEDDRKRAAIALLEWVVEKSADKHVLAAGDMLGLTKHDEARVRKLWEEYKKAHGASNDGPKTFAHCGRRMRLLIIAHHRFQQTINNLNTRVHEPEWILALVDELCALLSNPTELAVAAKEIGLVQDAVASGAALATDPPLAATAAPPVKRHRRWLTLAAVSASFGGAIIAAAVASVLGLFLFPLLPRSTDDPLLTINNVVNAGTGMLLIAAPTAFLAWALRRKRLRRPKVRWIAAAVFIPLTLYISAIYIDYARATSDARQTQQQTSAQPKSFSSDDFDDSLPCPVPGPSFVNNCETSGGTKRLAIQGRGTSGIERPSNAPTFQGDFYAETRFRPMEASTWANCFIEADDMQPEGDSHYVPPRNFELSAASNDQPSSYTALITRPYDLSQPSSTTILAAGNRPLPFIGVSSIPGWNNDAWTKLGLARVGNQYKFYVNDRLVLSYIAPERLRETIVSIGTNSHSLDKVARCEFDYFRVWVK
jgi:hypothetical protein